MQREAGFVVVVVLVAHEMYLAWSLARIRVRLLSLERFVRADLERLAAVEQVQAPAATPTQAPAATLAVGVTEQDDDDACTKVWTGPPAALVDAAARGANPPSQAPPRVALSMDVAPRAVASPPPLSRAAQLAAGLERPKSTRRPPPAPPVRIRTETLAAMASPLPRASSEDDASEQRPSWPSLKQHGGAASTRPPAGPAPIVTSPRFPPTLLSMQAQSAPPHEVPTRREVVPVVVKAAPKPSDDGETTSALASDPPRYAPRSVALRPPPLLAPLADPDLIGSEDQAEEAVRHRLGANEPTPRQARVKAQP
jgi:hypothetical protein